MKANIFVVDGHIKQKKSNIKIDTLREREKMLA